MKSLQTVLALLVVLLSLWLSQITALSKPAPASPPPPKLIVPQHLPKTPRSFYQPGNLHFIFLSNDEEIKVFNHRGELVYRCRCLNDTFNVGFFHWGQCPKGTFRLGRTVAANLPAFGPFFTPLYDLSPHGPMHRCQRHGIGLHGGGSRLTNPFREYQELLRTHGCLRVANHDLKILVKLIHKSRAKGRLSYLTVQ